MPNNEMTADWRELYREALFEADCDKVLVRIDVANQAIRCRLFELWQLGPADVRERSELDAAAYFLGLLRSMSGRKQFPQSSAHTLFVTGKQAS
jgi:hypothetical protein